jgi:transketolase
MRNAMCSALIDLYKTHDFVFLTGDLGFMALENLRDVMGEHFINAGVAEQNMAAVAAGMASSGLQCWIYSIAPFIYARPFEQIRNDICSHNLDVKLIGNGGGYGYGSMGPTHHGLEDYGILLTLQNIHVFIPAFAEDVSIIISKMAGIHRPAYLRLGKCEKPVGFVLPEYAAWRKLLSGRGPVILVVGPIAGGMIDAVLKLDTAIRPDLWVLSELPVGLEPVPDEFLESIERSQHLCVVEEHVVQGSVGQMIAHWLLLVAGIKIQKFDHIYAKGYPSGFYGSQSFHRRECGLDPESILKRI